MNDMVTKSARLDGKSAVALRLPAHSTEMHVRLECAGKPKGRDGAFNGEQHVRRATRRPVRRVAIKHFNPRNRI